MKNRIGQKIKYVQQFFQLSIIFFANTFIP